MAFIIGYDINQFDTLITEIRECGHILRTETNGATCILKIIQVIIIYYECSFYQSLIYNLYY